MKISWVIYYGWKQLFPSRGGRLFVLASSSGVAIGVAVLAVVLSIMDGFQGEVREQLLHFHGEVAVLSEGVPFSAVEEGRRLLLAVRGVAAARPFFEAPLLLEREGRYALPIAQGLAAEELDGLPAGSVLLGDCLVERLGAQPGDDISLLNPQTLLGADDGVVVLPLRATVAGTIPARRGGPDGHRVLMAIDELAGLFGSSDAAMGYELRLTPGTKAQELVRRLNGEVLLPPLRAESWMEMNRELLSVLALERAAMFFSMAFIVAVAAFAMGSFLAAHVSRRAREMGLLRALGARPSTIAFSFFLQSIFVGILGLLLGLALCALLLHWRDALLRILLAAFGRDGGVLSFYAFDRLPVAWSWWEFGKISAFALITVAVAGLLPAFRALRTDPSLSLRHE
ncbi:MAG: FtsX-like permease family protein [Puniceicoccales bacterium]|jgi:lipoprotein-releasing system permease protein|nr:FtsX-like permease family protein [Puniceicoccales bacterium]